MDARAQTPDATPPDVAAMLAALEKLRTQAEDLSLSSSGQLISRLNQTAASPSASWTLYQEAIKVVRFAGESRENTQFRDWMKQNETRLDDPAFRASIPFHLKYLALTLQRAGGAEPEKLVPQILNYAGALQAAGHEVRQNKEMMQSPIADSMFVRWFQVDPVVRQAKDWEELPGNLEGIMEKSVLPWWREERSNKAVEYWEGRLAREAAALADDKREFPKERFEKLRKPALLWSRAAEFSKIGLPNRGATEMFAVLQKYPSHPSFSAWATELEALLKPAPVAPVGVTAGDGTVGAIGN